MTIVARGLTFEAPDSIPSGWNTFRFVNESEMVHFAILERLPEGITIKEQQAEVAPVFQEGFRLLNAGQVDSALAEFGTLPEWYGRVVFAGGPGADLRGADVRDHGVPRARYLPDRVLRQDGRRLSLLQSGPDRLRHGP